jgi:hypothetical protein
MALSIPGPTGPIYRGLTTTMSPVSLGWAQQPPGGLRGERCYILLRGRPEAKADETSIRARPGSRQNQAETPRSARRT